MSSSSSSQQGGGAILVSQHSSDEGRFPYYTKDPRDTLVEPSRDNRRSPRPGQLTSEMDSRSEERDRCNNDQSKPASSPPAPASAHSDASSRDKTADQQVNTDSPPRHSSSPPPPSGEDDRNHHEEKSPSPPPIGSSSGPRGQRVLTASEHRSRLNDDDEYYAHLQQENGEYYHEAYRGAGGYIMQEDYSHHHRGWATYADDRNTSRDPYGPAVQPRRQASDHNPVSTMPTTERASETLNASEELFLAKYGHAAGADSTEPSPDRISPPRDRVNSAGDHSLASEFTNESSMISKPLMAPMTNDGPPTLPLPRSDPRNDGEYKIKSYSSNGRNMSNEELPPLRPAMVVGRYNEVQPQPPFDPRDRDPRDVDPRQRYEIGSRGGGSPPYDPRDRDLRDVDPRVMDGRGERGVAPPRYDPRDRDPRDYGPDYSRDGRGVGPFMYDPRDRSPRDPRDRYHWDVDPRDRDPRDPRDMHHPAPLFLESDQSINSDMSESILVGSRMQHMGDRDYYRGERPPSPRGRAHSPPPPANRFGEYPPSDQRNLYDRIQHPPVRRHASAGSIDRGGSIYPQISDRDRPVGGGLPDPQRSPHDDYDGAPDRGYGDGGGESVDRSMDDYPRRGLQRIPSQSTISTSGFRSFYSEAYTRHGGDSVSTGYQHHYGGPPSQYSIASRSSYGNDLASVADSRSYLSGSYYGQGPPSYSTPYGRSGGSVGYSRDRGLPPQPPSVSSRTTVLPERPLLEVAPGLLMHLMGTEETMKAIQRGDISVTQCVACSVDIHCHSQSEYVLCPDCRVVSPVNQLDNDTDIAPRQGGLVGLGIKTDMLLTMMEASGAIHHY